MVFPKFGEECKDATVIQGEDVHSLRQEERGTQKMFVNTEKIPEEKLWTPLMDEDLVVLCQSLHQSIGEEELSEILEQSKARRMQKDWSENWAEVGWSGHGSMAETQEESSSSAKNLQVRAFGRRSAFRESLPSQWKVDVKGFACVRKSTSSSRGIRSLIRVVRQVG